jgi:hypothetical protein
MTGRELYARWLAHGGTERAWDRLADEIEQEARDRISQAILRRERAEVNRLRANKLDGV